MRTVFTQKLEELAKNDSDIMVLTADLGWFFGSFRKNLPNQFINCGVAEENMVGIAAGLALAGKKVYCYSISPFLTIRALESIKINVCLHDLNVVLMGAGGGLVYGMDGVTHQATEDIAVMRSLPNMTVVAPGDLLEIEALAEESVNYQGPLYIRFGRNNAPQVHANKPELRIGKGIILNKGEKIALIACGSLLFEAKKAVDKLKEKGLNITLVSMPTIKPIDKELLRILSESHKIIFTLEDHSVIGGLGSAVSDVLEDVKINKISLPDKYLDFIGSVDYLYKKCGLDVESIAQKIYESSIR
ncbi:hypothetical protein AMJ47_00265 [Parcubacteria bacterium DG_72]|nr:MAG: hypothetical protein AMJ47_00265 [Parcubacteria bacterium DG_72]